jgi:DNA-binding transcriptional LysR family regulator
LSDEIVPVCAARIPDPRLRRAISEIKSARDLESIPVIWREAGAGTRRAVENTLIESGLNPKNFDQRFALGSPEAIKSLVIAGLGVGFFSRWELQHEVALGLLRPVKIPGLHIRRMFSWAIPSGEMGGLAGAFYQFANSIRNELSTINIPG